MGTLADMVSEDARRALDAAKTSGALGQAAHMARRFIRSRTRSGVDRFGQRFAPYAESTARQKGRFSPVTLTETGRMLGSLEVRENEDVTFEPRGRGSQLRGAGGRFVSPGDVTFGASVNLKGSRNRKIGRIHIFGNPSGGLPSRDWFGLTQREEERIVSFLGANYRKAIERVVPEDRRRRVEVKIF